MSRNNTIVLTPCPYGRFMEGQVAAATTPKPGTAMQIQAATALVGGRWTFELFNTGTDGTMPKGPIYILREDDLQGRLMTTAYAAGERCFLYTPLPGDELNLLLGDVAGTGDDHTKGEVLIIDNGTGEFIATTGSPESEPAMLLETITDPATDTLAWCVWSGY